MDFAAVQFAEVLFQLGAVATAEPAFRVAAQGADRGLTPAAANLNVIAAGERQLARFLLFVEPPRHVKMHATHAVFVVGREVLQDGQKAGDRRADRIHHIAAHQAG